MPFSKIYSGLTAPIKIKNVLASSGSLQDVVNSLTPSIAPVINSGGSVDVKTGNSDESSGSDLQSSFGEFDQILDKILSEESSAYDQYVALQDRWNKETRDWNERQAEIDRQFQASSAEQAMKFSADEAQKNRDWQEQMSNTAYQRAVKDLREAGLNPILAYSQGGASIGSGSQGTGYTASGSSASSATPSASKRQVSADVLSQMYIAASQNATKISAANIALQGALASAAASRYSADKSYTASQTRAATELFSSLVASLVRLV